jgi:hypothetical protein
MMRGTEQALITASMDIYMRAALLSPSLDSVYRIVIVRVLIL